jgi:hypothetical protein
MTHPLNQFTADGLRAQAITSGWRQTYNEALWDWLTASGYTQNSLNDKIAAAVAAGFDFSTFASAWDPSSLFASSEVGVWYDPSDLSTMFQNSDGTTAVAVGDPVGYIADKSGNGKHATQANAASRPVLRQTAGGLYYLEFDGTDDFLATAAIDFSATDKMSVFAGVRKLSDAAFGSVVELSASSDANAGTFVIGTSTLNGDASRRTWAARVAGSAGNLGGAAIFSAPDTRIIAASMNIGGASSQDENAMRLNGSPQSLVYGPADAGSGNFGNYPLYIGRRGGASLPFNGHIYSLIVRGALSDATLITNAESYVAGKTGVTL